MTIAPGPVKLEFDDYVLYTQTHPDDAFELIDGVIYKLSPEGDNHLRTRSTINIWLCTTVDTARYTPWTEGAFPAPGWPHGPQPDNMVSRSPWLIDGSIPAPRPTANDLALVIEISSTSRPKDQRRSTLYAELIIPEYWLVDLQKGIVVVHTLPTDGEYRQQLLQRGTTFASTTIDGLIAKTDFLLALAAPN